MRGPGPEADDGLVRLRLSTGGSPSGQAVPPAILTVRVCALICVSQPTKVLSLAHIQPDTTTLSPA